MPTFQEFLDKHPEIQDMSHDEQQHYYITYIGCQVDNEQGSGSILLLSLTPFKNKIIN